MQSSDGIAADAERLGDDFQPSRNPTLEFHFTIGNRTAKTGL